MHNKSKLRFCVVLLLGLSSIQQAIASQCNEHLPYLKPDSLYADYRDGTITDMQTGLMWQACSVGQRYRNGECTEEPGQHNYAVAVEAAHSANKGRGSYGYTDWRLPKIAELRTLVEKACHGPAINSDVFPATASGWYWALSVYAVKDRMAWGIDFDAGQEIARQRELQGHVRLVRYARSMTGTKTSDD